MARWVRLCQIAMFTGLLPCLSFAQEMTPAAIITPAQVLVKREIPQAIEIHFTSRGQAVFANNLQGFLGNLGYDFSEGHFDDMSFATQKPLDMNQLEKDNPQIGGLVNQVRGMMAKWFLNFPMKDPGPAVQIGKSDYVATFTQFSLLTDTGLLRTLGKTDGAVLSLDLQVKALTATTDSIRAWDNQNEQLGHVGLDKVTLTVTGGAAPVHLHVPFYVSVDSAGLVHFEALQITDNLATANIDIKYQKLVVPTVALVVDGKSYSLNNDELAKTLDQKMPDVISALRDNFAKMATTQLPALLNDRVKQAVSGALEQVQQFQAPGAADGDNRPNLLWGLILHKIFQDTNSIQLGFSAWFEDPLLQAQSPPLPAPVTGKIQPAQFRRDPRGYGVALAINSEVINRVLQLAFLRKNYENIQLKSGTVSLTEAPIISPVACPNKIPAGQIAVCAKITAKIIKPTTSFAFGGDVHLTLDILAQLDQATDGSGLEVVMKNIDLNTWQMDSHDMSFMGHILSGIVKHSVLGELKDTNQEWLDERRIIDGQIDFPPKILGNDLNLVDMDYEPSGNLVLYCDFRPTPAVPQ